MAINYIASTIERLMKDSSGRKRAFVISTYVIGKERILLQARLRCEFLKLKMQIVHAVCAQDYIYAGGTRCNMCDADFCQIYKLCCESDVFTSGLEAMWGAIACVRAQVGHHTLPGITRCASAEVSACS